MRKILNDVFDFWVQTWKNDRRLFWIEAIGTFLGMSGNTLLNIQSTEPNMLVVLLLFVTSAVLLAWASYIRQASFMILLMSFYALTSTYGLINLFI